MFVKHYALSPMLASRDKDNPYMKYQNISIKGFKLMLTQYSNNIKWPDIAKGHNSNNISFDWLKYK